MSFAHITLPTRFVERTAAFFERAFGYSRHPVPGNIPIEAFWLDIAPGQQIHVFYVEAFDVSPFESEFGRHVALFRPLEEFDGLKQRLIAEGAELIEPLRATSYERFFFREPVNGYVFEVIDQGSMLKDAATEG
jgi:hypothetical protein